ncbi:MAG: YitT family protein [Clostridiales bacterium]|nr:YitT family protein [Clostridiales bacterium]
MKKKIYSILNETMIVIIGAVLFAASLNMFLLPADVVQGGVTGIAAALNIRFGFDVGLLILLINIPLIFANVFVNGWRFILKSAIGVIITSVFVDTLTFFPVTVTDPFLCARIGGGVMGCGCGLLFTRGYTTGGSDLLAFLCKKKWKKISTGKLIFMVDVFVILGAALLLKSYMGIFYSALTIYIQTSVVDLFLSGADKTKLFIIVTEQTDAVAEALTQLERGVTVIKGYGYHTDRTKGILISVVKNMQLYTAKTAVMQADTAAFMMIADCSETYGEGFKDIF